MRVLFQALVVLTLLTVAGSVRLSAQAPVTDDPHPDGPSIGPQPIRGRFYYVIQDMHDGSVIARGVSVTERDIHTSLILPPDRRLREGLLHARTLKIGFSEFRTPPSGQRFRFPSTTFLEDTDPDTDGDGLSDAAEFIVGSDPRAADSDADGIEDGSEVQQGGEPLSGVAARTGIVFTADTPGVAQDVVALNTTALVADGPAGVAIFNTFTGLNPVLVGQLTTPAPATRVAWDGGLAAVALGASGLGSIDLSSPSQPQLARVARPGGVIRAVAMTGNVSYAGSEQGDVIAIDLATGEVLDRMSIGAAVHDLALSGDTLFVVSANELLSSSTVRDGLRVLNRTGLSFSAEGITASRRLFVGGGVAYATAYPGYDTFDVSDPARLRRLGAAADGGPNSFKQIVLNGSGLGIAAVGVNPRDDGTHDIWVYDVKDPAKTSLLLSQIPTPGTARALALYHGLAYVADGNNGLQVVSYVGADFKKIAPTVRLETSAPALTAEEGQWVRASALVTDDVQVRNVEFLLNGRLVLSDGNFPFETRLLTPSHFSASATFTLQARAVDTGGNSALSELLTFKIVADATPPRVTRMIPASGSIVGSVQSIQLFLSEPIDPATLTGISCRLLELGPDQLPGTADDRAVPGLELSFRPELNSILLTSGTPLTAGSYQIQVQAPLSDLARNAIVPFVGLVRVFDAQDTDRDGVPDEIELLLSLDPAVPDSNRNGVLDGAEDFDQDGLSNAGEILLGTDPRKADSDLDGIRDGDEDTDNDGLADGVEVRLGTNPRLVDSDGDGWSDEAEVTGRSEPLNPRSIPLGMVVASPSVHVMAPLASTVPEAGIATVLAQPAVQVVAPAPGVTVAAISTTLALPPVTVLAPAAIEGPVDAQQTTIARPPVQVLAPAAGGLPADVMLTTVARPPVTVLVPAVPVNPNAAPLSNTTPAQPPVSVRISNP